MKIAVIQRGDERFCAMLREIDDFAAKNESRITTDRFLYADDFLCSNIYDYDLVFVDTATPDAPGLELPAKLRRMNFTEDIAVTADDAEYAVDGYLYDLSAYVLTNGGGLEI